jgi:GlpG protein
LFGGISSVNSGLLGYLLLRGWLDPHSGLAIDKLTLALPLIWMAAALFGFESQAGQVAHWSGLGAGMVWGAASALIHKRQPQPEEPTSRV